MKLKQLNKFDLFSSVEKELQDAINYENQVYSQYLIAAKKLAAEMITTLPDGCVKRFLGLNVFSIGEDIQQESEIKQTILENILAVALTHSTGPEANRSIFVSTDVLVLKSDIKLACISTKDEELNRPELNAIIKSILEHFQGIVWFNITANEAMFWKGEDKDKYITLESKCAFNRKFSMPA